MKAKRVLETNYFPYAKYSIVSRAIPGIDGLKPVQRRILYSMHNNGLGRTDANTTKSVKIVGDVMGKYHPHGDSSIYEALVGMSTGYEGFNIPYIRGKGSFGKVYSRDLKCAAPRYTEAKLTPICAEFFDGIKENAVDIVDNFDGTEKEPKILPVKFPSILVNSSAGIAVGTSSNIPSFSLNNVCKATKGVLEGTIKTPEQLAPVLGAPEFTTGGFLHADERSLAKLCATGKGSFVISGRVEVYSNQIVVTEIPYCTTAESIIEAIDKNMKEGKLRGVKNVLDEIDLNGLRIVIEIKAGYNSRAVLKELCRYTPIRSKISFRTRVIIGDRCMTLSLLDLINHWIEFRDEALVRVYNFRLDRCSEKEYTLSTWEKIKHDIAGVVQMISKNNEETAKKLLMQNYGLKEDQADYLLDMKIRSITLNRANKALTDLANTRNDIARYKVIVSDKNERVKIIEKDLDEMMQKYGTDNKTILAPELKEEDEKAPEIKISDELTTVVYTKDGYIRRLTSLKDISGTYVSVDGKEEVLRWTLHNNQHILVFDRYGVVHKILVDDIDQGRGKMTETLYEKVGLEKQSDVIYADACGDYSDYFNLVYPNGRGTRVFYSSATGNRKQYKGLYSEVVPGNFWITKENQFFMVTHRKKAAYCDITQLGILSNRSAFKVARVSTGDYFTKLVAYKDVPNKEFINLDKYNKDYTVSIGNDILWVDEEQLKLAREQREADLKRMEENEEAARKAKEEAEKTAAEEENKII